MIDLNTLRTYYNMDTVFMTQHSIRRFRERGIKMQDIKNAVFTGTIIEQYEDDFPFPSCLILGLSINDVYIHIVVSMNDDKIYLITAYVPNTDKWEADLKNRKQEVEK